VTQDEHRRQMRQQTWHRIDELSDELWDLAVRIHGHPELAFQEHQAVQWLTEALEEHGFVVEKGVGGLPTAFRAVHPEQSAGPTVALLAEYDALPEIGHACGHNLIAAIALGAAFGLAPLKASLPGRLTVLGTPAEEDGAGKALLIEAGAFRDVDVAMMVHPGGRTSADCHTLAISAVKVAFHGKAAHASTHPEQGINALDAVIQTFNALNALRQHIRDGARVHGIITDGGTKPNIVPEYAAARFYVRGEDDAYRDELVEKLRHCAEGAALATGARLSFEREKGDYRAMRSNAALADAWRGYVESLGFPMAGKRKGGVGSTDMGNVSWVVPAIHPGIRIAEGVAGHTREFAVAACCEEARAPMLAAAKAIAAVSIDMWTDAELYAKVRKEFEDSALGALPEAA